MTTTVALDTSPDKILHCLRGTIMAAHLAYPQILHVEVRNARGDIWRLVTQDASGGPRTPAAS